MKISEHIIDVANCTEYFNLNFEISVQEDITIDEYNAIVEVIEKKYSELKSRK